MKTNYRALTSLRFVAASGVVVFHYAASIRGSELLPTPVHNLIYRGPIALCFFFVLSGFVLAISYRDKCLRHSKARRAFWYARFARLYPAYLLAFLLFAPMALQKYVLHPPAGTSGLAHRTLIAGAVLSPLLVQSWTSFSQAWNGPSWSLSVEAFFYFLFPYISFRLMKQGSAVAMAIVVSLWATSLAFVYAYVTGHLSNHFYRSYVQYHPLFWTPCFVGGIWISRFAGPWQRVPRALASAAALLTLGGIILICALCPPRFGEFVVTVGLLPLVALLVICCSHESSAFVSLLGSSPLYELGEVSYVTYIIQSPLWHFVTVSTNGLAAHSLMSKQVSAWQFLVLLPILLGASFVVSRYVEKPVRTWMTQRRNKSDRPIASTAESFRELVKLGTVKR